MAHEDAARRRLIDDLLENDAGYFEAGALVERLQGAVIARMPGLESLAAGCVIQRADPGEIPHTPDPWLEDIGGRLASWGIANARVYVYREAPDLEAALLRRGFQPREEIAVMRTAAATTERACDVTLRPVEKEADWAEKLVLHEEMELGPDGHEAPADLWVAMERRKCEAGYMTPYLLVVGDKVVGAANVAPWKGVLRLKNVVVLPEFRRRRVGCTAAGLLADLAAPAGKAMAGALVVADTPYIDVYTEAGYEVVSRQTEWSKALVTGAQNPAG